MRKQSGNHSDYSQISPAKKSEKLFVTAVVVAVVMAIAAGSVAYASSFHASEKRTDDTEQGEASKEDSPASTTSATAKKVLSSFIALEQKGEEGSFALWSRGRFAATSIDGKNLIFEVNPQMEHVGVWGSLGIDGSMTVLGSSEFGNLDASGDIHVGRSATVSGSLQASDITANAVSTQSLLGESAALQSFKATLAECEEARLNRLEAADMNTQSLLATTLEAQTLTADTARAAQLEATDISALAVKAEDIAAQTLEAQALSSASLTAETASVSSLITDGISTVALDAAEIIGDKATLGSLHITGAFEAGAVSAASLVSDSLEADTAQIARIGTDNLTAGSATFGTLTTDNLSAGSATFATLTTDSLIADALSGVLQTVEVASQSCGTVLFGAIGAAGEGYVPAYAITVPLGTTAVFLQPERSDGDWVCAWEVEQISATEWSIIRRFPKPALKEMSEGNFMPTSELSVHWLAVGAR